MGERITPISFLRRNMYFIYCILQVGGILNRMFRNVDNTHLPIENRSYNISSIHVQQWLFKAYNEIKILIFQLLLKDFASFLNTTLHGIATSEYSILCPQNIFMIWIVWVDVFFVSFKYLLNKENISMIL